MRYLSVVSVLRSSTVTMQVYTNRKRAQTKAVNQARKEQEAAASADQHEPGQPHAGESPHVTSGGPSHAGPLPMAFAGQPPEGPSSLSPDAGASQPAFEHQQQPQQQYGAMLPPPAESAQYPAQHQHSNDATAYMQMAPQGTAAYAPPQPQSAAFPVPMAQPSQSAMLPQPAFYGAVPQAAYGGMAAQSVSQESPLSGVPYQAQPPQYAQQTVPQHQHQQQQQPHVLNLRPLPGQSMADAAMAAIQVQQVRHAMTTGVDHQPSQLKQTAGCSLLFEHTRFPSTGFKLLWTRHRPPTI